MPTKTRYSLCLLFLLLSGLVHAERSADRTLETVRLQLKWFHAFQFAGYYMAKEKGFYADVGLNVEIIERDPKRNNIQQVIDGEADYGVADSALLLYRADGKPVRVMAPIFQHSPLVLIARGASDIVDLGELRGKRVSYQKGLDDTPLLAMLQEAGIGAEDIEYVPLDFSGQAFIDGKVDAMSAYLSDQPFRMRELGIDFTILNPHNYGIDFYGDILFATDKTLDESPERSERFMQASIKGWQYALEHPNETIGTLIANYHPQSSREHLEYEAEMTRRMIAPSLVEIGYTSPSRFYRIAEIYQSLGKLNKQHADKALKSLIWDPDEQMLRSLHYLNIAFVLVGVLVLGVLAVLLVNSRLKNIIAARTHELTRQKRMVDQHVIISETDLEGNITAASQAFCRRTGHAEEELLGKNHNIVRHPERPPEFYSQLWAQLSAGNSWDGDLKNIDKQGNPYWIHSHIEPIRDFDGRITGYRAVSEDITDRKRLEIQSATDPLTGLANRLKLDQVLEQEFARSKRYATPFSVILLDVDHFKSINDQHGHLAGDTVLKELATALQLQIRATDLAGRWGGEEFMVICPGTTGDSALACAEKLRQSVQMKRFPAVEYLTISLGVSSFLAEDDSPVTMVQRADQAMYRAKSSGRNRACSEPPGLQKMANLD
ncbi:diguanylate cyclase [Marinobacterium sp. D7]|uniref:diguanylate cyclase n=1 Tax=Marinobacterium ramblicola TaxID=2849041 RepID=UPI001C2D631A|nr:diguanylate cyclase [Marinobacterium ramblicola]